MKLHLIRHAKTDQNSPSGEDYDRALLPRGKRQCVSLYKHLVEKQISYVHVYCSQANRTQMTWKGIENAFVSKSVDYAKKWYLCNEKTLLETILSTNKREDLLIVGHNFGISDLANYFLDDQIVMGTSEYLCIEFDIDRWAEVSRSTGSLVERFRPSDQ